MTTPGQIFSATLRAGPTIASVNGGIGDCTPPSPFGDTVIASSAITLTICACTSATGVPGSIRQLTFAFTRCGNAFGACPPSIMLTMQVVRSVAFQDGSFDHSRAAAASSGGDFNTAR